jgi:excisionase family DNA binding protein
VVDGLVTLDDACERLNVSRPQLFELVRQNGVRFTFVAGRRYLAPAAVTRLERATAEMVQDEMDEAEERRQRRREDDLITRTEYYEPTITALLIYLAIPAAFWLGWLLFR